MGMDQYFVATAEPTSAEALWSLIARDGYGWYWRKHYRLMEFFVQRANFVDYDDEGDFDDGTYELSAALLDELEATLKSEAGLPDPRDGEWFDTQWEVAPHLLEHTPEKAAYALEAVQWARERLNEGKRVYYCASY